MKAETFINKIQPDRDGLDFDGLRKEGVSLIQEVSGDIWTDFNLHDPGITILEQLCYGLTDLAYRTQFPVADYLASGDGRIDYKRLALHRPDEIFSCRPITEKDYRKLILAAVPNVDNVWVVKRGGPDGPGGLYDIYVQLRERASDLENGTLQNAHAECIEALFGANRNLCEDLAELRIVERVPYSLGGEIEIDGKASPAKVLGEIYFRCAQYLSPKVAIRSCREMYEKGMSLDELFTGTLAGGDYHIADEDLHSWRGHFSIPELIGEIARIEGIKNIKRLFFVDGAGKEWDGISLGAERYLRAVASLRLPLADTVAMVSLSVSGKSCHVSVRDVETEFHRLNYKQQATRSVRQNFDWVDVVMPTATFRKPHEYVSIQNHFPDVYGLNANGVPASATSERKAQAMQLKAYLLMFEQMMADFLQHVEEIPSLFSCDHRLGQSYFFQALRNEVVPDVEQLYRCHTDLLDEELTRLHREADDYHDRRNRVLDYLLALYGEQFGQHSLSQFSAEDMPEDVRIQNKIAFLKRVVELGKNRSAAFNWRKAAENGSNGAGLIRKVKTLLGLWPAESERVDKGRSRTPDMHLIEHILLRPMGRSSHVGHKVGDDFYSFRISILVPGRVAPFADEEFRHLTTETVYLNCPAHIHPEVFWLEHGAVGHFETLHKKWIEAKRASGPSPESINAAAGDLILFLLGIRRRRNG